MCRTHFKSYLVEKNLNNKYKDLQKMKKKRQQFTIENVHDRVVYSLDPVGEVGRLEGGAVVPGRCCSKDERRAE